MALLSGMSIRLPREIASARDNFNPPPTPSIQAAESPPRLSEAPACLAFALFFLSVPGWPKMAIATSRYTSTRSAAGTNFAK
jgi:hypothetical protein